MVGFSSYPLRASHQKIRQALDVQKHQAHQGDISGFQRNCQFHRR